MRQTLLRIRLDDLFSTAPLDGITTIGAGWLLLIFVPLYAAWDASHYAESAITEVVGELAAYAREHYAVASAG